MRLKDINEAQFEVTPNKSDANETKPPRQRYVTPRASKYSRARAYEDSEDLFDNMPV